MSLAHLNLSRNPFKDMTPSRRSPNLVWAGMTSLKRKIEQCYQDCLSDDSKQIVLNWGPYGGGKTFSSYYFIRQNSSQPSLKQIYLRSPTDGNRAPKEFFKSIIDDLTFEGIHEHITSLIEIHGENGLVQLLVSKATSEFAKAIVLMGSNDVQTKELMHRFLYSGLTKSELRKLGLAKDIQSETDVVKFLSGLLSCYAGDPDIYNGKLVFWLDEMENIIYYTQKNYKAFSQVLRDLFDSFSGDMLVFLNFTLAEGEEHTIEVILGGALWSRITKKIRYIEITESEASLYVNDLLEIVKIDLTSTVPFTQPIISELIRMIPRNSLTPREINKYFSSIINYAVRNNAQIIETSLINSWANEFEEDN